MEGYVSTSPPTWGDRIRGLLGYRKLPIKVNCWYCNHNSYILTGSKQTERYWHCGVCENYNVRDENGNIVDIIPSVPEKPHRRPAPVTPEWFTGKNFQKRSLCEDCEKNQALIYQIMSDYIKDESDPDYDYYVRTADEYKSTLQEKYPLCESCQKKVDELVAEQRAAIRSRIIGEKLMRSLATPVPIKPTKFQYTLRGVIWILIHGMTILFCLYAPQFTPISSTAPALPATALSIWRTLAMSQETWHVTLEDLLHTATDLFGTACQHGALVLHHAAACIYIHATGDMRTSCQWPPLDYITLFYVMNALSYFWIGWHPLASKTFQEKSRMKRIDIYMNIQRVIFLARFMLIWIATTTNQRLISAIMEFSSYFLPTVLVLSVFIVKVAPTDLPTEKADKLRGIKTMYSSIKGFAMSHIPLRQLKRPQPLKADNAAETNTTAVTTAVPDKKSRLERVFSSFRSSKPENAPEDDRELDRIMAGFHKIKLS